MSYYLTIENICDRHPLESVQVGSDEKEMQVTLSGAPVNDLFQASANGAPVTHVVIDMDSHRVETPSAHVASVNWGSASTDDGPLAVVALVSDSWQFAS